MPVRFTSRDLSPEQRFTALGTVDPSPDVISHMEAVAETDRPRAAVAPGDTVKLKAKCRRCGTNISKTVRVRDETGNND